MGPYILLYIILNFSMLSSYIYQMTPYAGSCTFSSYFPSHIECVANKQSLLYDYYLCVIGSVLHLHYPIS